MLLKPIYNAAGGREVGVDEAGRGCLAGPVFAAAVVWHDSAEVNAHPMARWVRDSKRLSAKRRDAVREFIEGHCAWGVGSVDAAEIDRINILRASHKAMHKAIDALLAKEAAAADDIQMIVADGDRFTSYISPRTGEFVPHACIVDGDAQYLSIAAASILAKTHRDRHVLEVMHPRHPAYGWDRNKCYGTPAHLDALRALGATADHRRSFAPVKGAPVANPLFLSNPRHE
jgi:ribonuclease HII